MEIPSAFAVEITSLAVVSFAANTPDGFGKAARKSLRLFWMRVRDFAFGMLASYTVGTKPCMARIFENTPLRMFDQVMCPYRLMKAKWLRPRRMISLEAAMAERRWLWKTDAI